MNLNSPGLSKKLTIFRAEMYVEKKISQYMLNSKRTVSLLSKSLTGQSIYEHLNP